MGKTSQVPSYPSYSGGTIKVNGQKVATVKKKGDSINSSYNMPQTERGIYDYAQNALLSSLPNINVFSPEVQQGINSQLDAYKNQGMQTINSLYTPLLNNLKNDMASRFGNLNNSMFMDNLNNIEDKRAAAISTLAQNLLAQRNNLYDQEINRRYNYLNTMNNLQNQITDNMFKYLNLASQNSSSGNSYNQQAFAGNLNAANSQWDRYMQAAQLAMQLGMFAL